MNRRYTVYRHGKPAYQVNEDERLENRIEMILLSTLAIGLIVLTIVW